jgi:hypothetical protein
MNPIKTPQEMLAEMAGIPHMAGGSAVDKQLASGAAQLVKQAIQKFKSVTGKAPSAEQIAHWETEASRLSQPTSVMKSNPARLAGTTIHPELLVDEAGFGYRASPGPHGLTTPEYAKGYIGDPFAMTPQNMTAREDAYQLGTRTLKTKVGGEKFAELPTKLKVLEDRDAFLTQAMTGRRPSGTRQKPFIVNVDDLNAQQASQEAKGIYSGGTGLNPGDRPTQSITPSADYFAEMAASKENKALPDNLVSALRAKLGRNPTEDEINALIADLNVLGHDYTGMGSSVFGLKPTMPKGRPTKAQQAEIDAWRQKAIDSGEARSAVDASGSDLKSRYPSLQREVEWGPEPGMKTGGSVTPEQMRHLMLAYGHTPQKFAKGESVQVEDDTVYDPVTGLPLYGSQTTERRQGHVPKAARVAEDVLRNIAGVPLGVAVGGTNTLASGAQMLGVAPDFLKVREQMSKGVNQRAPVGGFLGQAVGGMFADPLGYQATTALAPSAGAGYLKNLGYSAAQGFMTPTQESGLVGEPFKERLGNAAIGSGLTTGIYGALRAAPYVSKIPRIIPKFRTE